MKMDDEKVKKARMIRHEHEAGSAIACPFCRDTHAHVHLLVDITEPKAFWLRVASEFPERSYALLDDAPRILGPRQVSPEYEVIYRRGLSVETRSVHEERRAEFEKKGWLSFDDSEDT